MLRKLIAMTLCVPLAASLLVACGDDDGGCTFECDTEYATQCDGQVIRTCRRSSQGCLTWVDTTDCQATGLYCDDTLGAAQCTDSCQDLCPATGDTRCQGNAVEACQLGQNGCRGWVETANCDLSGDACQEGTGDATCVQDCATTPPGIPGTPSPVDGASSVDASPFPTLDWADASDAARYEVYFGACPAPAWPAVSYAGVTASERTGLTGTEAMEYCWRVVAFNAEGCRTEGPEWSFTTACTDPVAGIPTVTSGDQAFSPMTNGTYRLTFSEPVENVQANLTWTPITGSGTLGSISAVDDSTYDVSFTGVAPGDAYTLTVGTGVTDHCNHALAAAVNIQLTMDTQHGDTCADPQDISNAAYPYGLVGTFDADVTGGSCDTTATNTVFYAFTPANTGFYRFDATNATTTIAYARLAVFEGQGCAPYGTEVSCATATDTDITSTVELTGGVDYLVLFYTDGDTYTMVNPTISVTEIIVPSGGICTQAEDITSATFPHTITGDFQIDTVGGSCDTTATNAVFYTYTPATTDSYRINVTNSTTSTVFSRLAIFEGETCSPYGTERSCLSVSAKSVVTDVDLTAGVTYLLVFYTDGDTYPMVDPVISISPYVPHPGDTCGNAADLDGQTLPTVLTGSFTRDATAGSCDAAGNNIVWATWTAPTTGWYTVSGANATTASTSSRLAVFEGAGCAPTGTELACGTTTSNSANSVLNLTQGTTYTVAFYTSSDSEPMEDPTLDIQLAPEGVVCPVPADVTSATFPYALTGTFGADGPGGSCDTGATNAVYYAFTPATSGTYQIDTVNNSTTNAYSRIAVYGGTACSPLDTEVACVTNDALTASAMVDLTAGTTYLIQVYTDGESFTMVDPEISIALYVPAPGEMCSAAVDVSAETFPYTLTGTFDFDPSELGSCDEGSGANAVYFRYTPSASDWYLITAENATTTNAYSVLAVYESAACGPVGPELACKAVADLTASTRLFLTAGQEYLILFHTDDDTYTMVDPSVTIATTTPPGPGEMCGTAVDVSAETFPYTLTGTFDFDPSELGSCDIGYGANAVYFRYTPSASDWYLITAENASTSGAYSVLAVYESAACGPVGTELACKATADLIASERAYLTAGQEYLILFHTDGDSYTMVDPRVTIATTTPPPPGLDCTQPADVGSANHYLGGGGEHCWSWTSDSADTVSSHMFTCDSATGGDVVVAFTTGAAQTSLQVNATVSNTQIDGYLAFELTDSPCLTGASLGCVSASGTLSHSQSYAVTPNTTYYLWAGDGYADNYLPDVVLCVQ